MPKIQVSEADLAHPPAQLLRYQLFSK